jgi:hypothetical protein
MINVIPLLFGTLAAVLSTQAVPTSTFTESLERRIVGSLSCKVYATGPLVLYNTKTKASQAVTFANNYRLNDALNGQTRPSSLEGQGNPRLLSSYPGAKSGTFEFLACTESQRPGFEDLSPVAKNGTAYGHISGTNTNYCLKHLQVYGDTAYLASE